MGSWLDELGPACARGLRKGLPDDTVFVLTIARVEGDRARELITLTDCAPEVAQQLQECALNRGQAERSSRVLRAAIAVVAIHDETRAAARAIEAGGRPEFGVVDIGERLIAADQELRDAVQAWRAGEVDGG